MSRYVAFMKSVVSLSFNREPETWPVMVPGIGGQKPTPYVWIFDKWMRTQKYALTKPNSDEYSGITVNPICIILIFLPS